MKITILQPVALLEDEDDKLQAIRTVVIKAKVGAGARTRRGLVKDGATVRYTDLTEVLFDGEPEDWQTVDVLMTDTTQDKLYRNMLTCAYGTLRGNVGAMLRGAYCLPVVYADGRIYERHIYQVIASRRTVGKYGIVQMDDIIFLDWQGKRYTQEELDWILQPRLGVATTTFMKLTPEAKTGVTYSMTEAAGTRVGCGNLAVSSELVPDAGITYGDGSCIPDVEYDRLEQTYIQTLTARKLMCKGTEVNEESTLTTTETDDVCYECCAVTDMVLVPRGVTQVKLLLTKDMTRVLLPNSVTSFVCSTQKAPIIQGNALPRHVTYSLQQCDTDVVPIQAGPQIARRALGYKYSLNNITKPIQPINFIPYIPDARTVNIELGGYVPNITVPLAARTSISLLQHAEGRTIVTLGDVQCVNRKPRRTASNCIVAVELSEIMREQDVVIAAKAAVGQDSRYEVIAKLAEPQQVIRSLPADFKIGHKRVTIIAPTAVAESEFRVNAAIAETNVYLTDVERSHVTISAYPDWSWSDAFPSGYTNVIHIYGRNTGTVLVRRQINWRGATRIIVHGDVKRLEVSSTYALGREPVHGKWELYYTDKKPELHVVELDKMELFPTCNVLTQVRMMPWKDK